MTTTPSTTSAGGESAGGPSADAGVGQSGGAAAGQPAGPPTRDQIRTAWDTIAPAFDQFVTPGNIKCGQEVLGRSNVGPGTSFLDIAAGSGALSIPAAQLGADVVATDISPGMIERLTNRARSDGLANLQAKVMDGCALDFHDDTFDVTASQHGVSVFPNLAQGLSEMCRVTKPGGQVIAAAFGALQKAEFLGFFMGAVLAAVPGFPGLQVDPPPLPFQLADPDAFRAKLLDAGLSDVVVETITLDIQVASAEGLWNTAVSSNPIAAGINARLSEQQRSEARQILAGMLRERSAGAPAAVLHTEVNIGTGRK